MTEHAYCAPGRKQPSDESAVDTWAGVTAGAFGMTEGEFRLVVSMGAIDPQPAIVGVEPLADIPAVAYLSRGPLPGAEKRNGETKARQFQVWELRPDILDGGAPGPAQGDDAPDQAEGRKAACCVGRKRACERAGAGGSIGPAAGRRSSIAG